jgi:hypothetical protein
MPASTRKPTSTAYQLAFAIGSAAADCERALRPYADDCHRWPTRHTLANLAAFRGDTALALDELTSAEREARWEA